MEKSGRQLTSSAPERIARRQEPETSESHLLSSRASAPCILLVDRDISFLTMVSRRLAKGGFRVITAQNAPEALQRLIWQYFDVVITSDRLDGISGAQLAAHLKSLPTIPRGSAVPIVMLSEDSELQRGDDGPADRRCSFDQLPELASIVGQLVYARRARQ